MELLHNLWNVVSTEDENLMKYVLIILGFIENYVTMKFFTNILNITYTKKQRNIYLITMNVLSILSTLFIVQEVSIFIHLIVTFIIIKYIFKTSIIKAILAEIIPMIVTLIIESVYIQLCLLLFNITPVQCNRIIIYRVPIMLLIYSTLLLISISIKKIKSNISIFSQIDNYRKKLLILNLVFIVIIIAMQFYLLIFYNTFLPMFITILSLVILIAYAIISIYSIIKTINLEITKTNLEQSELHNKTLELLYNNMRAFKHDFSNIITAFGGYIYAEDLNGLKKYYDKIVDECHINNNLSTLNPEVINNAAIYNILATKYYKADELDINIDLQVFINLNDLKMDVYDFSRILGILLDNAIEAASKCNDKKVKIEIRDIKQRKCQMLVIENTYLDKNIDISRLSEKGYTSKTEDKENHGIGLWQVAKMIKKHPNVLLDTSKNDEFFKQELAIYYK